MKERIKKFIEKQKNRKKSSLITDGIFILLIIVFLIPTSRVWLKEQVSKITMASPRANSNYQALTSGEMNMLFVNEQGETVALEDFSGEVIFLNYWATWCPPCRAEMPAIQSLYNEYQDKMKFLFVTNEKKPVVNSYFQQNGYDVPVYNYGSTPIGTLESQSIPTTFIITRDGKLALKKVGAAKWDSEKTKAFLDKLIAGS
ncbi:MAG: TlpA family protein disulfide reductase [Bacteroidota bacterium]